MSSVTYLDFHVRMPSATQVVPVIVEDIVKVLDDNGFARSEIMDVKYALNEALVNSVVHGNGEVRSKQVCISYALCGVEFRVRIEDQGCGFDPHQVADPLAQENLTRTSGRGIFMMREFMDLVEFNEMGNCVTMVKRTAA